MIVADITIMNQKVVPTVMTYLQLFSNNSRKHKIPFSSFLSLPGMIEFWI